VAAGLDADVEGRGSSGSGAQRWRQRGSCSVSVEGGDDSTEGGGGVEGGSRKSGSLTAQNQIFTVNSGFTLVGYSPLYPGIIRIGWHSIADTKNEIIGIG
jgi:hypothetical protein